jgi:uncharacterized protein with FMN-binding domain
MGIFVKASTKRIVGISALSALTLVELIQLQQANAAPVVFTGSIQPDGGFGGNLQVAITVDAVGGIYKITGITTPVQPTGSNGAYANFAIPTLTSEALVAQSASITGVSGASSISAAWIKSLASAIAAAATAGERIGSPVSGTTPTPSPTPTTSNPAPTPPPTPKPGPTINKTDPLVGVLAKLVTAGTITQAQSNAILTALQAARAPHLPGVENENESEGSEGASNLTTLQTPRVKHSNDGATTGKLRSAKRHGSNH